MHGRHRGLLESDTATNDLNDWCDAVRRAARAGDDAGFAPWQIRAMDNGCHRFILRWRRQKDESCSGPDVLLEILAPRECARALEHELDTKILPRQFRRITVARGRKLAAGDDQVTVLDCDRVRVAPVHRVEPKQVSEVVNVAQII